MPETRAAKRLKLETTSKSKKRTKPKSSSSKQTKRPKLEPPSGEDIEDETLKEFDLDTRFGACIGIARLARWERAKKFGLKPPNKVKQILTKYSEDDPKNQCLWTNRV